MLNALGMRSFFGRWTKKCLLSEDGANMSVLNAGNRSRPGQIFPDTLNAADELSAVPSFGGVFVASKFVLYDARMKCKRVSACFATSLLREI